MVQCINSDYICCACSKHNSCGFYQIKMYIPLEEIYKDMNFFSLPTLFWYQLNAKGLINEHCSLRFPCYA